MGDEARNEKDHYSLKNRIKSYLLHCFHLVPVPLFVLDRLIHKLVDKSVNMGISSSKAIGKKVETGYSQPLRILLKLIRLTFIVSPVLT